MFHVNAIFHVLHSFLTKSFLVAFTNQSFLKNGSGTGQARRAGIIPFQNASGQGSSRRGNINSDMVKVRVPVRLSMV